MDLPHPGGRGLRLKPLQVPGFEQPLELRGGRLTFGRAEDNDVCLPGTAFPSISTHHARIVERDGQVWVEDLDSRNGTFVNDARVERQRLAAGDIVQLGPIGPRFLAVSAAPLSETMFVDPRKVAPRVSEQRVTELVASGAQRLLRTLGVVGVLVVAALVVWGVQRSQRLEQTLEEREVVHRRELDEARQLIADLQGVEARRATELATEREQRDRYVAELEAEIARSEDEARHLEERLGVLETSGASAAEIERLEEDIQRTRSELGEARTEFAKFDPVNLEQTRLGEVRRVREAIVLLEVVIRLRDRETGAELHLGSDGRPNFEGKGLPWTVESTGSGFCVDPEGWILTNAHVVGQDEDAELLALLAEGPIEPQIEVQAVFSGTSLRRPVRVERVAHESDLALLKIEPFEGMPYLTAFSTETVPPSPGSDVFLFGFPLGNFALQEGETVIASTFRGILSRQVGGALQVDAGVHPGNSGGPITDARGRVVGVVVSVQAMPDSSAVYTIGYGIPIGAAAEVWPPGGDGGQEGD